MELGDYLFYSVLGICVVFLVLVCIMALIKVLTALTDEKEPAATETAAAPAPEPVAASAELAPGSAGDVKLYGTDPRTAAMIMAIVADELGKPLNELRFISIREVD